MVNRIRLFLGLEAAIFIAAALIHFEVVLDGYYDREAGIAESVIAVVLLIGLLTSLLRPAGTRRAGILVQGFALVGTFVGVTLLVTLGPRTTLDIVIHLVMVIVLVIGLIFTVRTPRTVSPPEGGSTGEAREGEGFAAGHNGYLSGEQEVDMQTIHEVMTKDPLTVDESAPVSEAARIMRDANIGDVLVTRPDGSVCGIVTDRDLALSVVAEGNDPTSMVIRDVCNHTVESVESGDPVAKAVKVMSGSAIRRLPVIDDGRLVGIVTLGDLAMDRDPGSALASISEAPPNN